MRAAITIKRRLSHSNSLVFYHQSIQSLLVFYGAENQAKIAALKIRRYEKCIFGT
jgi:hypothetical protein